MGVIVLNEDVINFLFIKKNEDVTMLMGYYFFIIYRICWWVLFWGENRMMSY